MEIHVLSLKDSAHAAKRERGYLRARMLLRAATITFSGLLLASCAGTMPAQTPPLNFHIPQDPTSLTSSALKQMLSGKSAVLPQLVGFYEMRGFQPVWTSSLEGLEMEAEIRGVLSRADEQGLRVEDYLPPTFGKPASGEKAAQYDIAITAALFRYARDVKSGRLQPNNVYMDIKLPAVSYDAAADVSEALKSHTLKGFFETLTPPHPEYRRLVAALAKYRAIDEAGGWSSVSGSSEIKLDGKDSRIEWLIARLSVEDPILVALEKPSRAELTNAVRRFQLRNGLSQDGRVGDATLAALNVPASVRVEQIAANLERWRWVPAFEQRYIAVNVPDQSVRFVRDGSIALSSRVVVGRKASPTPITRSEIEAVVVNPPWNIPGDIAARDLLPQLRKNPNYLAAKHMVVTDGLPNDPYGRKINWRTVDPAEFPYAIKQLPGPTTALGALMLDSPNDFDVYLHDTPNKKLFDLTEREISNGCIRVQQIFPLASLALTGDTDEGMAMLNKVAKTRQTKRLALDEPLPVYFLYWTVIAGENGSVQFRPDIYERDAPLITALKSDDRGVKAAKARIDTRVSERPAMSEDDDPSP